MNVGGCCGLVCSDCPAFIARMTGDEGLRVKTAAEWSAMYGAVIEPSGIDCVGCTGAGGPHFHHCGECEVRSCCTGSGLASCGLCPQYPGCATITAFVSMVPSVRAVLDSVAADRQQEKGRAGR